ncbi:MAG: penicillin-binding protein 2 [Lactococcus raffinolactis]|nr:penicillin-binding protein 2 [Lactococcus raffinolactis]MDN5472543.1 penicillin-binding protein 2 [Lactococcus raffinolactis]MDN5579060.1 penicillin-binding protein 2 [Lactococcus raffinolactis]MDN6036225.1 penicillin-binding protein 2 [Lactococcus raffinolactis]MDN6044282.1 penicillin-binding protein 2 [Lactococcus raffinolactis]
MKSKNSSSKNKSPKVLENPSKAILKRVNVLFFFIFALFLILVGRLYHMQIANKSFYDKKLATSGSLSTVTEGTARGQIYDSQGLPLVSNRAVQTINFTRSNTMTAEEMRQVAIKLVSVIPESVKTDTLTERDKKDFFLADHENLAKVQERLSAKERINSKTGEKLSEGDLYAKYVKKVTDEEIAYDADTELAAKLYKRMNATSNFATTIIASGNFTAEQQATIAENERSFKGISVGTTWEREYAASPLTSILGTVTSEKTGIPAEDLDDYLKKGYSRNDRVGTSYLEKGYEDELHGSNAVKQVMVDKNGKVTGEKVLKPGEKGKNLKLTIDSKFQQGVQDILRNNFAALQAEGFGGHSEGAYAVVMNPTTGAIYALGGINYDLKTGAITDDALGTIQNVFIPGSVVKMGTIAAGWQNGVLSGNQVLNDQPIQILGSQVKQSWFTNGMSTPISAVQALEYSSNTYMIQTALDVMGQPYHPNMTIYTSKLEDSFKKFRKTYGEFGLGVMTGLDIPGEVPGFKGEDETAANYLDESFGQYDNYTPLQLAQYAATIANDGKRVAPHLVEGIYDSNKDGSLGGLTKSIETKSLNTVDISLENVSLLQQGMYQVTHGGSKATGKDIMVNASVNINAKTGTSETYKLDANGNQIYLSVNNVVAYAPSENPQIAIGVMVPDTVIKPDGTTTHANQNITRDIVNLFHSMYGFK